MTYKEEVVEKPKRQCEVMPGDRLRALMSKNPAIEEDIKTLWGTEYGVNVGPENRYAVFFENTDQAKIVALAKIIKLETGKAKKIAVVHDVIVSETERSNGMGRRLIDLIIRYGQDKKFSYLELTCRPAQVEANKLYVKAGFKLKAGAQEDDGTNLYRYYYQ